MMKCPWCGAAIVGPHACTTGSVLGIQEPEAKTLSECKIVSDEQWSALHEKIGTLRADLARVTAERDEARGSLVGIEAREQEMVGYPEMDVLRKVRNERDEARAQLAALAPKAEALDALEKWRSASMPDERDFRRVEIRGDSDSPMAWNVLLRGWAEGRAQKSWAIGTHGPDLATAIRAAIERAGK